MDTKILITAVLTVPILLVIATSVITNFADTSRTVFENTITNEDLGVVDSTPKILYTDYPVKADSETLILKNTTSGSTLGTLVEGTNYTINYNGGYSVATVNVTSVSTTGSDIHVYGNYTGYSASGYTHYTNEYQQTLSGYNLASMLPLVYIAIVIIGIILGAFGISKLF